MTSETPKYLYRIVKPGWPKFDRANCLLPHCKQTILQRLFYRGCVPMVTEQDIEFIERYFEVDENHSRLKIESSAVKNLRSSCHSYLKDQEYFGIVKNDAIVDSRPCKKNVNYAQPLMKNVEKLPGIAWALMR